MLSCSWWWRLTHCLSVVFSCWALCFWHMDSPCCWVLHVIAAVIITLALKMKCVTHIYVNMIVAWQTHLSWYTLDTHNRQQIEQRMMKSNFRYIHLTTNVAPLNIFCTPRCQNLWDVKSTYTYTSSLKQIDWELNVFWRVPRWKLCTH